MWFISRRPGKQSRDHARARRFVPQLEVLENRALLSTLTVVNAFDSGAGSLRDAITGAKSGDTIMLAPSLNGQTITLTSDQITINKSLGIEGPGASLLAISGNNANRVFDISGGLTVTFNGLTITQGLGKGDVRGQNQGGGGGGAILNGGSTVNLANDIFANNAALDHGGAITNGPGSVLSVVNCSFLGNQALGQVGSAYVEGGAIWNTDNTGAGATATVVDCTFIGNRARAADGGKLTGSVLGETAGGAIHSEGPDSLTVRNSTFVDNQAIAGNGGDGSQASGAYRIDWAHGGAIVNDGGQYFAADGCTFSDNQAIAGSNLVGSSGPGRIGHAEGGAVDSQGMATITNCEFDHNDALGGNNNTAGSGVLLNGRAAGGAIGSFQFFKSTPAILVVGSCTFTDNQAIGGSGDTGGLIAGIGIGGGIANDRGGTATVTRSTFTGNQALGGTGATGQNGADGLGGAIANILGSALNVSGCTLAGNQALGGAGGPAANGGDGFGGGIFNDGLSIWPTNAGTPATLTISGSTITNNAATGGAAGSGGRTGQGLGGGAYLASGGVVCLDLFTSMDIVGNTASTSNDDAFGVFAIC
ncbi:MAG TPA: hypothetical protein VJ783_29085 [Pirellulales bacterium]|nr:hypothetical protein [Pirellulales bacterium]